ncbi:MAG: hypothetical protein ACRC20_09780 [Segniliparus sp.]|uniref:hypothetical protein n=1 Tax=Segniliparus sp. TaxID=2804064 RepID=UPI003F3F6DEA
MARGGRLCSLAVLAFALVSCGRDSNHTLAYCQQLREKLAPDATISSVDCDGALGGTNAQYKSGVRLTITVFPGAGKQGDSIARHAAAEIWQAHRPELAALITVVEGAQVQTQPGSDRATLSPSLASQPMPTISYLIPLFQTNGNFASLPDRALYNELQGKYGPQKKLSA